jgi:outer membrane receptor protein involved in Fe transport
VDHLSGNRETFDAYDFSTDTYQTLTRKVPGFWTLGLGAQWRQGPHWTWQALLSNALDKQPPLRLARTKNSGLNGVDTRYADPMGRSLKLRMNYKF